MAHWLTTAIGDTEYAAEFIGKRAAGFFKRTADGTFRQILGHGQTPGWLTERAFRRWVLDYTRDDRLGVLMPDGRRIRF